MSRIKAAFSLVIALLLASPANAGTTLLWHTKTQTTYFGASGNSMGVGTDDAASACSSFAANNLATIEVNGWTNGGGTPWPVAGPGGGGWTVLFSAVDTNAGDTGGAVLYKKLDGSETCPITVANSGGSTAGGGQAWQLQVWACTGTPPATAIDPNSQIAGDFIAPGPGNMVAPAVSGLANSNDISLLAYFDQGYNQPYAQPAGYMAIDDTMGTDPGGFGATEILTSYKVLSANSNSAQNSANGGTFVRVVAAQVAINACTGAVTAKFPLSMQSIP